MDLCPSGCLVLVQGLFFQIKGFCSPGCPCEPPTSRALCPSQVWAEGKHEVSAQPCPWCLSGALGSERPKPGSALAVTQPREGFACESSIGAAMGAPTCASSPWLLRDNLLVAGQPHGWANDQVLAAGSRSKLETRFSVLGCASICSVAAGKAAPRFPARCPCASLSPLKPWLLLQLFCLSPHTERPCFSGGGQALLVQLKLLPPNRCKRRVVRRPEV